MGCSDTQLEAIVAALKGGNMAEAAAMGVADAICATVIDPATLDVTAVSDTLTGVRDGLNVFLLIYGGALVFVMHGGFAMLEAGAIRSKNAMNILLCTILDAAVAAIMWYCVGFGFAYGIGDNPNEFIGDAIFAWTNASGKFTGSGSGKWVDWFFQWAFCATAATIPAGSVAERFNFNAYLGYSAFISGFVYPVVAHWTWCLEGWLGYGVNKPVFDSGMIDFAGSGVIHMTGGLAGLCGSILVGPRLGRFDADGNPVDMPGHSAILVVLGTILLWFGWYGFNPASVLLIDSSGYANTAGRAAVTTTLAGAAGGLACLMNGFRRHRGWDLVGTCNGILCGFVTITACCHVVEPWAAILAGFLGGLWFDLLSWVLLKLKIDDPLGAFPMHAGCGAWGVFFTGLLAKEEYVAEYYNWRAVQYYGAFYVKKGTDGGGKLLAAQCIGILVIIAWVCGCMVPFFYIFKMLKMLRIPPEEEEAGLDRSKHGGSAYNHHAADTGTDTMRGQGGMKPTQVTPMTA